MKIKAFVLPGGDVVSCHADVFTQAGFEIKDVERLSDVEWEPFTGNWTSWFVGSGMKMIAESDLRSECVEKERNVVEGLLKSYLMHNPKPKLHELKAMLKGEL